MIFRTGKYKGHSVEFVKKTNPSYIEWVRENAPAMLKEKKEKKEPKPAPPRMEPPEESNPNRSAIQPNLNFFNEKSEPRN